MARQVGIVLVGVVGALSCGHESSSTSGAADLCQDTCEFAHDGACDDGGAGSQFGVCDLGTDCGDCGLRSAGGGDGGDDGADGDGRISCENTCEYAYDEQCDDGGPDSQFSLCEFGSDCADCGPRGGENPSSACGPDAPCPADLRCQYFTGRCVECFNDYECPSGYRCDESQTCISAWECDTNDQCPPGQYCASALHQCFEDISPCQACLDNCQDLDIPGCCACSDLCLCYDECWGDPRCP